MRRRSIVIGIVAVAALGGVGAAVASGAVPGGNLFAATGAKPSPSAVAATVQTASIERRTMAATAELDGTLGYDGDLTVGSGGAGVLTWLPEPGTVIKRGGRLFELDGSRRPRLFLGARPLWRTLDANADDGADILEIERNLKALGFAPAGMKVNRHWDAKTTTAVKRWEKATGQTRDGVIALGDVVVLPQAIRVRAASASLGTAVGPGTPLYSATGATQVVTVDLAATKRDRLAVGDAVAITLPDDSTIDDPAAVPALDQAPVTVLVTIESHADVLAVPVDALVALLEGGYAVEVVDDAGARHYVGVTLGLFDDQLVEISGTGLDAGTHVVVPA